MPYSTWTKHIFYPLGRLGAEALMRSEADTCQQSPPCIPPAVLMSPSKAAPPEREAMFSPPKLFCVISSFGVHNPELSTAQLPHAGTSANSDSETKAIVTITELVLSFRLGGLGTHFAEQLTR